MVNVRNLKVRIKAVSNIRQITRAMEMVATTKLRRFQSRAETSGPYAREIEGLVRGLAAHVGGGSGHPLFEVRDKKPEETRVGVVVITSDRGLCGAYNGNLMGKLRAFETEQQGKTIVRYVIGRKGMSWLMRRKLPVEAYLNDPPLEKVTYRDGARLARGMERLFLEGKLDQVWVAYTAFKSMSRYEPQVVQFLPLGAAVQAKEEAAPRDYLLEPSSERIFGALLPKYLETRAFNVLIESLTSEYATRRVAMKNATDAANTMVGQLKRTYNRARQERITKELLEIVGGAEALAG